MAPALLRHAKQAAGLIDAFPERSLGDQFTVVIAQVALFS